MFSPHLLEKIAQGRQYDRLQEADKARLLKHLKNKGSSKLTLVLSGTALAILIITQLVW